MLFEVFLLLGDGCREQKSSCIEFFMQVDVKRERERECISDQQSCNE